MKPLNANTKIAAIIKQNPDALEAIISISPKFEKLRNPILRKIMAARASISMACKIAGCTADDFYNKLAPLGFTIDKLAPMENTVESKRPDFLEKAKSEDIVELDVRPALAQGNDPFTIIMDKVKTLQAGQILKLINTFEPVQLIPLLSKKGFESYTDFKSEDLVETYFYKTTETTAPIIEPDIKDATDWDAVLLKYKDKMRTVDVRELEMPLPMMTILEELENLPSDTALFVYHKRIPLFLLPELKEKAFDYRIKEISDSQVHLLIFKL
ncbi:MAG: DUF2249 domain-containing protein [Bacteroidetes bacterium]|nr:DUF2249 domain-containing protein [Bacteroidota bacterium]